MIDVQNNLDMHSSPSPQMLRASNRRGMVGDEVMKLGGPLGNIAFVHPMTVQSPITLATCLNYQWRQFGGGYSWIPSGDAKPRSHWCIMGVGYT